MSMRAFTTKRASEKRNSDFSFANERREQTRPRGFTTPSEAQARRAFTLIETMVAVTILTLAIAGPLVTASRAIVAARTARDQLTASYLAQEGAEYARRMRDNEFLAAYQAGGSTVSSTAWANFLNNPVSDTSAITQCRSPKICTLDPVQGSSAPLTSCPGNVCTAPLYLLSSGLYSQQNLSGSTLTPFVRSVQAFDLSATEESIVTKVSWSYHSVPYSVTITEHLTAWQ